MDCFSKQVRVVDQGEPFSQTGEATVTIYVQDVNDKKPKFEHVSQLLFQQRQQQPQQVIIPDKTREKSARLFKVEEKLFSRQGTKRELELTRPFLESKRVNSLFLSLDNISFQIYAYFLESATSTRGKKSVGHAPVVGSLFFSQNSCERK